MWSCDANPVGRLNFSSELSKDAPSNGNWKSFYDEFCSQNSIIPCPYINFGHDETSCRVANCIVDLPNFQAMLLGCTSLGANVKEISLYNVTVSPQHLLDLSEALKKLISFPILRLEYLSFESDQRGAINDALQSILSGGSNIDYVSLKGNLLGDEFLISTATSLKSNCAIKAINLSDNMLSDTSIQELLRVVALHPTLSEIGLAKNCCSDGLIVHLLSVLCGFPATPDDEAVSKAFAKLIVDKNKAIKDINKKRKKAGQPELAEFASPPERILKINGHNTVLNHSLATIDLSMNTISNEGIIAAATSLKGSGRPTGPDAHHEVFVLLKHPSRSTITSREEFSPIIPSLHFVI